jgi:hypothetical protein
MPAGTSEWRWGWTFSGKDLACLRAARKQGGMYF